uniref:Uncharacterized protein n=1 Tax=mine drainage metagenome TaxID=410659 RepID=E6PWW5_9ZZZZ
MFEKSVIDLNGGTDDKRIGVDERSGETAGKRSNLIVGKYLPVRLFGEYGEGGRRDFFSEYELHGNAFRVIVDFVFFKADVVLLAEDVEDANDRGLRFSFALLVFPDGVGVDAKFFGHLVLVEVELLAGEDEFFAKREFGHGWFLFTAILQLRALRR